MPKNNFIDSGAIFSPCRKYRYTLWREWDFGYGTVNFLLLNPSTADENVLDPTLTRCLKYSQAWGYKKMIITNIFSYRSTCPFEMKKQDEPIGTLNDFYILLSAQESNKVVLGFGNHGNHLGRGLEVLSLLRDYDLYCLDVSKTGFPKHPLYLKGDLNAKIYSESCLNHA